MGKLARIAISLGFASLIVTPAALARDDSGVSSAVMIKATPDVVWKAIRDERFAGPYHRKILSLRNNGGTVQETFDGLPMLGSVTCVLDENEQPGKRIDFNLLKSDKFREFRGSWVLQPSEDGKQTTLKLSTYCDTGSRLPFARSLTNSSLSKKISLRLTEVKDLAESSQLRLVKNGETNPRSL